MLQRRRGIRPETDTDVRHRITHYMNTSFSETNRVRVQLVSKETLKRPLYFPGTDMSIALKILKYGELLLFVTMPTEICKYLSQPGFGGHGLP